MAVYTHVDLDALKAFLEPYGLSDVMSYRGIEEGVENTNYFVEAATADGPLPFIVTILEKRVSRDDIPFFLGAMAHMNAAGLPTPEPLRTKAGETLSSIAGKPAIVISFLEGRPRLLPGPADCEALGALLARMHRAGAAFAQTRKNDLSIEGWKGLADACASSKAEAPPGVQDLIARELPRLASDWPTSLPKGLVHADLFPDNVFFNPSGAPSGVIDFYFSCTDFFAYDLAVTLNAWASPSDAADAGAWRQDNSDALLAGYETVRPLQIAEKNALPALLRGAAMRFLLTRLYDWLHRAPNAVVKVKDPLEYARLLEFHAGR
ncbi:MAG: homoserine kinase [Pseudomonadota bacterium]